MMDEQIEHAANHSAPPNLQSQSVGSSPACENVAATSFCDQLQRVATLFCERAQGHLACWTHDFPQDCMISFRSFPSHPEQSERIVLLIDCSPCCEQFMMTLTDDKLYAFRPGTASMPHIVAWSAMRVVTLQDTGPIWRLAINSTEVLSCGSDRRNLLRPIHQLLVYVVSMYRKSRPACAAPETAPQANDAQEKESLVPASSAATFTEFKANRSVVAGGPCGMCRQAFELSQSVVRCGQCQNVYHNTCWEEEGGCNRSECKGDTKTCPACGREIKQTALKCRYCGQYLDAELKQSLEPKGEAPGASDALTNAIIGIFCLGPILGPLAVYKGIKALNAIAAEPGYTGRGKAIAGIVIGIIVTLLTVIGILSQVPR